MKIKKPLSGILSKIKEMGKTKIPEEIQDFHSYEISMPDGGKFPMMSNVTIRNYETILRAEDKDTHCKCGAKLKTEAVRFSIWALEMAAGFGRVKPFTIQYCPHCDPKPSRESASAVMCLPMDLARSIS